MKILGKILLSMVFGITLTTQANAQTDSSAESDVKQIMDQIDANAKAVEGSIEQAVRNAVVPEEQLITSVKIEMNVTDLTQDVTALFIRCSLSVDPISYSAFGYAVLYDEGALNAVFNNKKDPYMNFIPIRGFHESGVKQSISVNLTGDPLAVFWKTGECTLGLSNKDHSSNTGMKKIIDYALAEGQDMPMDCSIDTATSVYAPNLPDPEELYLCYAPQSESISSYSFERFGKTPEPKKK